MLDINKIAQEKINTMHESGQIKEFLEREVEKLVLNGISSALSGYEIRRQIEEKVKADVSKVAANIDFTAYNSFIAEKVKQITSAEMREDIAQKVQSVFDGIFIKKRESIKLSEIFEAYRDWLISYLDDGEKYELNNEWYADIEEDERYKWLTCTISQKEENSGYAYSKHRGNDFSFAVLRDYKDKTKGYISTVYFKGVNIKENFSLNHYTVFEALMLNLLYNNTPIEIDVEDDSDIDTSLGLDI